MPGLASLRPALGRSQNYLRFRTPNLDTTFRRLSTRDEVSPKRWTDDYLAAFAEAGSLTLVTFDRALAVRSPTSLLLMP